MIKIIRRPIFHSSPYIGAGGSQPPKFSLTPTNFFQISWMPTLRESTLLAIASGKYFSNPHTFSFTMTLLAIASGKYFSNPHTFSFTIPY
jgi:hypothetical protein